MMKKLYIISMILCLYFITKDSFAGAKTGSSLAQFLKIGVGARAAGMGEAFVALSNDATALYWNPAGIAFLDKVNLTTTHTQWFAGLTHDFIGVTIPAGDGGLGAGLTFFGSENIEITTLEQQEGTGMYYKASDMAVSFSYANRITDYFSFGITAKYVQLSLYNETANGFAIDVGSVLNTGFKGIKIGMNLSNIGTGMKYEGRDLIVPHNPGGDIADTPDIQAEMTTEVWPFPTNFKIGISSEIIGSSESFISSEINSLTIAIEGNRPTDNDERANAGLEYVWDGKLALRMGYKYNYDLEDLSFGAGYSLSLGSANFNIDYAWARFGTGFGDIHRFTFGISW